METRHIPPLWLDRNLFPFTSQWITIEGNSVHYVDEGEGPVILFVHGTPEWSFGFRDLIKGLKGSFRCIAVDFLGFGLSDKPLSANYSCPAHAQRLQSFIAKLELKNITLLANDFGGGIGLSYAIENPDNINSIILFNTWMWSLKSDKHYSGPAKILDNWLGKFLYLQLNFPVNVIMPSAYGDKRKLTKKIHAHYKKALGSPPERVGAFCFSKELMNASDWWQSLWEKASRLQQKPILIFWGLKDKFVPRYELKKWRDRFAGATVITFPDAGHFVQEEKGAEMIASIKNFISTS